MPSPTGYNSIACQRCCMAEATADANGVTQILWHITLIVGIVAPAVTDPVCNKLQYDVFRN
jgi:hypothetical protein